ncbi:MAG TPA: N-acetylglucosamine-6-phosphate deacetylase [Chitinophagaceae bacterium]
MRTVLYNGRIFTGDEFLEDAVVEVQQSTIISVGEKKAAVLDMPMGNEINLEGGLLVPAFIDIQLYGGNGKLFGEHPSLDALNATVEYSRSGGATLILPTVATNSQEIMIAAIEAVREYWQKGLTGVAGLHLEGPYINPLRRGAHIPEHIRKPSVKDVEELLRPGMGVIKMMTLAPEVCTPQIISYLQEHGVIVSAGHTNATFSEAMEAFDGGIKLATHLFNAMSPLQHRAPGMAGAIMHHPDVNASIIPDGHHVDYPVIAIAKKVMGERLFIITDAVTENTSGVYQHRLQGDKYVMPDGTLSGSALTMLKAVKNCIEHAGIAEDESFRMASLYPARVLSMHQRLGRIAKGFDAEMVWFDKDFQLKGIFTNGSFTRIAG